MIFVTKIELRIRFWKRGKQLPLNYETTLSQYANLEIPSREKIVFSWLAGHDTKNLNASAARKNCILVNLSWAMRILEHNNEDTLNAFKATIGHELTHKDNDLKTSLPFGKRYNFVSKVNEVHADFGGAQKMLGSQRDLAIKAIKYKQKTNSEAKHNYGHPSWSQRLDYIQNYDFNEKLIRRIAKDTNCTDEKLIRKAIEHFSEIKLN